MAEQAWYRCTVEKVYAAARDAWAEAVPGLRAAWAKHEQHYPERTRLTPPAPAPTAPGPTAETAS